MSHRYDRYKVGGLIASIGLAGAALIGQLKPVPSAAVAKNWKHFTYAGFRINKTHGDGVRYVAVGDSYTCGTGAKPEQSWPSLLTRDLRARGVKIDLAANLGVNGWTTQQALDMEMPEFQDQKPTFATLMIGVNDTYRATTVEEFRVRLQSLMDRMQKVLPDKSKMVIVTIPNYIVTPSGAGYAAQGKGVVKIVAFNAVIQEEAAKRGLSVVDVFPLSQKMEGAPDLTAHDGMHPSAKEYALWEKQIYPTVSEMLQKKS
ncbi:MAG: SGNH/GDSL hydrolase family protein [Capsulimonas sp.]|uniref:SGNH/GDSL hydrolase family protein n=1 Tax=Capsulimonas sp. TaxID=2494211 RepID=UPI003266FB67